VSDLVVRGGDVLTAAGRRRIDLVIREGRITDGAAREGAATVDATGLMVVPGFVDLQCNGAGGVDLTAEPERLAEVAALLPRWGVTAWLPTIVSSPDSARRRALDALANLAPKAAAERGRLGQDAGVGAVPLGLHFEGPFLAPGRRRAHAAEHLRRPDPTLFEEWSRKAGVALVTLAPELPSATDLVRTLVEREVVVALGHSSATVVQARAAIDAGASYVTHLFNAMDPLHHREPGLVGTALSDRRVRVGLIADGVHVHPTVVELVARLLGPRLTLVTDAVAALGASEGPVTLGDVAATTRDGTVRTADGTLAGSVLSLDQAVRNLMTFAEVRLAEAVRAVTVAPCQVLGIDGDRGLIAPGARGDLVLLDEEPESGPEVVATIIGGAVAYDRRIGAA
jgi:N-acetylglucosamine-6-phosphate deacetylase